MGPPQSCTTRVRSARPTASTNWRQPVDVGLDRVRRTGQRLVGAAEADQVRGHGAQPLLRPGGPPRCGRGRTRWAGRAAGARSRRRPGPRRRSACAGRRAAWRSAGRRGSRAGRRSAPRVSARAPRRSVCRTAGTAGGGPDGLGAMSGERCDVAVVGAGLVGLSLAYELACLGASVTVVDAGHPGRATDAGAGILSPVTSMETDERAVAVPAPGRRALPGPAAAAGVRRRGRRRGRATAPAASSPSACAPSEDEWFAPFAEHGAPPLARRGRRDHAGGGRLALPAARAGAPRAARARFGPGRRPGHGGRAARGARRRGASRSCAGAAHGVDGGRRARGRRATSTPSRWRGTSNVACDAVAVAGGAWTRRPASGSAPGCPVGPTKGQIVHLGVEGGHGRVADRAAAAHPLSRALARGAGGLRGHVRGRRRLLGQRHRRRVSTSSCASA